MVAGVGHRRCSRLSCFSFRCLVREWWSSAPSVLQVQCTSLSHVLSDQPHVFLQTVPSSSEQAPAPARKSPFSSSLYIMMLARGAAYGEVAASCPACPACPRSSLLGAQLPHQLAARRASRAGAHARGLQLPVKVWQVPRAVRLV